MKYYWKDGFYIDEIHFDFDAETGEYTVPDGYTEITEELYRNLLDGQAAGKRIVTGADGLPELADPPEPTVEELREQLDETLWSNYKSYQRTYVDPEDLTLANTCATGGSEKGAAVRQWVLALWARYYEVKDLLAAAETLEALRAADISTATLTPPPYTIRELNEEAAAFLAQEVTDVQ